MKHKSRRLLSAMLVLAMVVSLISSVGVIASAGEGDAVITVGTQTAAAGEEATVPVAIANNPGFATFVLDVSYDTVNLTLTSVEKGDIVASGALTVGTSIIVDNTVNMAGDGTILNLKFTVNAGAEAGNYAVSLALKDGDSGNFCNATPAEVPVSFVAGKVTVTETDNTAPTMTKLTATVGGADRESTDGTMSWTVGETVSAIKVTVSEPVSLATGASTDVTISGGSIPAGTVYGTLSLDASDATNQTLIITPNAGNETAGEEGTFTFTVAADTVEDTAGNGNAQTAFTLTVSAAAGDTTIDLADFESGVYTIAAGGEYLVGADATGLIQIATTDPVTIVGQGSGTSFSALSIDCTVGGVDLTIEDLYISGLCSNNPAIDFLSGSNALTIAGTSALNVSTGTGFALGSGAMIHVPFGSSLTLGGDGTLYMYKTGGGANIGGNYGEVNGAITFSGGTWFLKASQTGALIGTGQGNGESLAAGDVTINGGNIYAIHVARGAVIGGGGMSGGYVGSGGNVWVNGGTLYLGVDFSGASIGGGGGSSDNATALITSGAEAASKLYVTGGTIKNIISSNAASYWGVTVAPAAFIVDDTCISATKVSGTSGTTPAYLCTVDLSEITPNASGNKYVVTMGETTLYSGNGYEYDWCGNKSTDIMNYYIASAADTNLYLYLSGENHTLAVNGQSVTYVWDAETGTFSVEVPLWTGSGTQADPYEIKTAADLAALATYTNGGNTTKGLYWALKNDIDLSTVCGAALGSWTPIGNRQVSSADVVTGYAFLGEFNGSGYSIQNLYVLSADGYLGLFGAVGGNDNHDGTDGYGTVRNFKLYGYVINTLQVLSADFVGGVCGMLCAGGTISDVINYATVLAPCVYNVGGLVGFAGTNVLIGSSEVSSRYTNNPSGSNTNVLRCGNEAMVIGYNKVGGIVGQNAAKVTYCYNKGWIIPHLSGSGGGTGGIVGRNGNNNIAYEEGTIAYCYNAGKVTDNGFSWTWQDGKSNADNLWKRNSDTKWIGGICGFCNNLSKIRNCYSSEFFTTLDNSYTNMKNPIVGHLDNNNTYNQALNVYCLDTLWYNSAAYAAERGTPMTQAQLQTATYGSGDILTLLGTAFKADTTTINGGYPILRWQVGKDLPSLISISIDTPPTKVAYDASEVFSPTGMVVLAVYSDGSKSVVTDYTYPTAPLAVGTTSVDITYGGLMATQAITVSSLALSGIAITANPTNLVYAADETFDPAGMVVTATYNENAATNAAVAYDATGAAGYTYGVDAAGLLTVTYTEGAVTKTATLQLTKLTGNAPTALSGVYQLDSADDLLWFANQVNVFGRLNLNAELLGGVDLGGVTWTPIGTSDKPYCGEFDGNDFTVTLSNTFTSNYAGIFGFVGSATVESTDYTVSIHDLTAAGTVDAAGRNYAAGIAGYVRTGTLANCTNMAAVTASGYAGGIAGYVYSTCSFTDCTNEGAITAIGTYCAGIAGYTSGAIFTRCANSGAVTGAGSTAGIAGYVSGTTSVEDCANSGIISGSGTVAGICANLSGTDIAIQNCGNTGSVTGSGTAVGGITGNGYGAISGCYNTGAVQGTYYVGGIVGQNYSAAVTNCYNTGAITGTSGSSVYQASGGLAGVGGTGSFTNCYNSGKITATNSGALVGASNNSVFTLTNCYYVTGTAPAAFLERTAGKVATDGVYDVSEAALYDKAAELGAAYKTGLASPILTWQPDEVSVTATDTEYEIEISNGTIAGKSGAVVIGTGFGSVTLDENAAANLLTNANGADIKLTVAKKTAADLPARQQGAASGADMLLEISLTCGGNAIAFSDGADGTVTIRIPFTPDMAGAGVTVYYISETGTRTAMSATYADGYVTFTTTHLSLYAIEETSDYTVSLTTTDTDKNVGETATVSLSVTGADSFAALQTVISYDKTKVSYAGNTLTGFTVTNNASAGTLTITRAGTSTATGAQGNLTFTVKSDIAAGSAEAVFSVTSAKVGVSGSPSDVPDAVTGADIDVAVHNLTVTFTAGSNVTMTEVTAFAKYGQAGLYTSNAYATAFTEPAPTADTGYTLDSPVWDDGSTNVTYASIAGTAFTENTTYTATATKDVYTITYVLGGGTNNASNPASYSYGDSFTLSDPERTAYTFGGWYSDAGFTQAVTGVGATDTGNKTFYAMWQGEVAVTLPSQATAVSGVTDGKAVYGTDIVFTVAADPGYTLAKVSYKVGSGSAMTLTANGGQYTIPGTVLVGAVTVTVEQTVTGTVTFITFDDYKGAPVGFKVLLLSTTAPEGYKYRYDGADMFYSEKYDKYVCFIPAEIDEVEVDAAMALGGISCVAGTSPVINYDGNANQSASGLVDIIDAQLIYDLYMETYNSDTTFTTVSGKMRLAADVNGDGTVDTSDVQIIINLIHGIA